MRVKIHGGTVSDGQASLCSTCRSATIIRGAPYRRDRLVRKADDPRRDSLSGRTMSATSSTRTTWRSARAPEVRLTT